MINNIINSLSRERILCVIIPTLITLTYYILTTFPTSDILNTLSNKYYLYMSNPHNYIKQNYYTTNLKKTKKSRERRGFSPPFRYDFGIFPVVLVWVIGLIGCIMANWIGEISGINPFVIGFVGIGIMVLGAYVVGKNHKM